MGAVESCCGKRANTNLPSIPLKPINVLADSLVTFASDHSEFFSIKHKAWFNSTVEVEDARGQLWFKLVGNETLWSGQKKLILNPGDHHATVERKGDYFHIYKGSERRATIKKEVAHSHYVIFVHKEPYPTRYCDNSNLDEPRLFAVGDFKKPEYWILEADNKEHRKIARIDTSPPPGEMPKYASDTFSVLVPAQVDVALVVIIAVIIDGCHEDDGRDLVGGDSVQTGRDSMNSSMTGDDRWKPSYDNLPIQLPGKTGDMGKGTQGKSIPPLWPKGKTPR